MGQFIAGLIFGVGIGMVLMNAIKPEPKDYQISLEDPYICIYDNNKLIATMPFDTTQTFTNIILKDNE